MGIEKRRIERAWISKLSLVTKCTCKNLFKSGLMTELKKSMVTLE
jgi:hypothetical protein